MSFARVDGLCVFLLDINFVLFYLYSVSVLVIPPPLYSLQSRLSPPPLPIVTLFLSADKNNQILFIIFRIKREHLVLMQK